MRLKEYFDYSKYAEVLHLNKFELSFCVGYFILALGICFYSTPEGSLFSPDSTVYIKQAEEIYKNHNLDYIISGPMYSILIALVMDLGIKSEQSAAIIPIIFYSLLGFPLFLIGKIISNRPITGYLSCIACLFCSKYLLYVSTYAWTEMPYIFFSVVAILFIAIFNRYGYVSSINIAGIFISLAILTRYTGVVLIPIGIMVIAINIKDFKKSIKTIISYSLICTIPIGTWILMRKTNVYVMSTNPPIRSFSTTIHQFRSNLEQLFYNDYGLIAIIVMLFVVIAIIAIYLNKQLTAFTKDTIPLMGYIILYCIMIILLSSSYDGYSLVNGLHLRYMIPIFPFMVLFVFSSFSDIYNSKNNYNTAYKILPVILCTLLAAQGAAPLYSQANSVRTQSLYEYADKLELNEYISEYNITNKDTIYFDTGIGRIYSHLTLVLRERNPKIKIVEIKRSSPKTTILDNLTSHFASDKPPAIRSILDLIKENKNHSIYLIAPRNLLKNYIMQPPRDICFINPIRFSKFFICNVNLKNNETCNASKFPGCYILEGNISTALAGNYMDDKYDQLFISNADENMFQILDLTKGSSTKLEYENKPEAAWLNANHSLLSGDFMSLGYDQALHIAGDRIIIEDFCQGIAPAIIRYSEAPGKDTTLRKLIDAEEPLAGDFLNRGHSQVLFVEREGTDGKIVIADFSKEKKSEIANFAEIGGNSTLMGLMLGEGDRRYSGDFMGLGYSQLIMINCNRTGDNEPKIIIADFSEGKKSASVKYQENWGESTYLGGWLDADDTQLVGDFMGLGHSQVLFINHGHAGGKITIVDFSQCKMAGKYKEDWNQGSIFQGWLDINDSRIAGDFKELGYSQVLFLNNGTNGTNATIVEFINGYSSIVWQDTLINNELAERIDLR